LGEGKFPERLVHMGISKGPGVRAKGKKKFSIVRRIRNEVRKTKTTIQKRNGCSGRRCGPERRKKGVRSRKKKNGEHGDNPGRRVKEDISAPTGGGRE